ncbi:MAG: ribosome small subunit-dependent GTPase A [Candidatus Cloacimonetes bacterium]|nr:ribosome small subunit-dependent GTPase A [Candidatus Cloacimonadota bacterium]
MQKKKDKKKFKRQNLRLKNIEIGDLDSFYGQEVIENKKAEKKIPQKSEKTQKSQVELKKGRILEVMSNYNCRVMVDHEELMATMGGRLKQINLETRNPVAAGDFVNVDVIDNPRIEEILPRINVLSRYSEDEFQKKIIIAANIDQVVITASWREPDISLGLIDRYLCAAAIADISALICVNKIDLADDIQKLESSGLKYYLINGYRVLFTSALQNKGIDELRQCLLGKETVFSGHSGAGKSSLLNRLQSGLELDVAGISSNTGKGKHTTTQIRLLEWNFGGYLVDTPGIKTFGLKRDDIDLLPRVFPGFEKKYRQCKFNNCTHIHETDCAIKNSLGKGLLPGERYESYLRIYESLQ